MVGDFQSNRSIKGGKIKSNRSFKRREVKKINNNNEIMKKKFKKI